MREKDKQMLWDLIAKLQKEDPKFPTMCPTAWMYKQADKAVAAFTCQDGRVFYMGVSYLQTGSNRGEYLAYTGEPSDTGLSLFQRLCYKSPGTIQKVIEQDLSRLYNRRKRR